MRIMFLCVSCLMLITSIVVAIKLIKEKKPITDPYLLLSILTFAIALRMVLKMIGI